MLQFLISIVLYRSYLYYQVNLKPLEGNISSFFKLYSMTTIIAGKYGYNYKHKTLRWYGFFPLLKRVLTAMHTMLMLTMISETDHVYYIIGSQHRYKHEVNKLLK